MATTIVKTIGTAGDYTTLQAWEDACPANLVTADQIWQGQCKNQEFTSASTLLTISGTTVDATRYVELTTEAGASFIDNASASTNALRYNAANGAAIRITAGYAIGVIVSQAYTRISKLQFSSSISDGSASAALQVGTANGTNVDINKCIFESFCVSATLGTVTIDGTANVIRNSVVITKRNSTSCIIATISNGTSAYNCTFASLVAVAATGIRSVYATSLLKNCYIGNATAPSSGTITKTNSYSDVTATGYTVVAFSTATFQNITNGSHDLRLKSGSGLLNVGADETTYAATDILNTARSSGAYDVGAYELVSLTPALVINWTEGVEVTAAVVTVTVSGVTLAMAWTEGAEATAIAATATGVGVITTPVLKNNTGTILASETGVVVNIYNSSTGALVVRKTGQTSSAGGIVTVTDALIVPATVYAYEVVLAANGRRLPTATAA